MIRTRPGGRGEWTILIAIGSEPLPRVRRVVHDAPTLLRAHTGAHRNFNLRARQPYVLELSVAHRTKPSDRLLPNTPILVSHQQSLQGFKETPSPEWSGQSLHPGRRDQVCAHDHLHFLALERADYVVAHPTKWRRPAGFASIDRLRQHPLNRL